MDATRTKDGAVVIMKRILKSVHPFESEIGRFLSSPPLTADPRNHCCPILDVLDDPEDSDVQLIVMPILRDYYEPKLSTVGEAMELFRQLFEVAPLVLPCIGTGLTQHLDSSACSSCTSNTSHIGLSSFF